MSHNTLNYREAMRRRGYRVTPQRELILDCVCEAGRHTSLEDIYARAQRKSPGVNLATVYRTLRFMADIGVVVTAESADHGTLYEIASQPSHHHLVCRSCRRETRLDGDAFQAAFDAIERSHHFKVVRNHLTIYGLCEECQHAQ
jgi:Fe2+ or Zn2+ uptake regulation protein